MLYDYSLLIFLGFFILLSLCVVVTSRLGGAPSKIGAWLVPVGVSFFYGLRGASIGVDTREYISRFDNRLVTEDYLFSSIGLLLEGIGVPAQVYLAFVSLLTSLFLFLALKNFTNSHTKAALFLILIAMMPYGIMGYVNIIRQGLAVSIILFSISLAYKHMSGKKHLFGLISFFVHKTTSIVYIASLLLDKARKSRYKYLLIIGGTAALLSVSTLAPAVISMVDNDTSEKFTQYATLDTSESPYLIYAKLCWAALHLFIISRLPHTKGSGPLYSYTLTVLLISIATVSNTLVSSRVLASVDFLIPALYAIHSKNRSALFLVGLVMLVLYALVSPFLFNLYDINFNW